jgi:hypothetical protein
VLPQESGRLFSALSSRSSLITNGSLGSIGIRHDGGGFIGIFGLLAIKKA